MTAQTNNAGRIHFQTNRFIQVETGLHRWDGGAWTNASSEIVPSPGGASATNARHQVSFAANANSAGAVTFRTPDQKLLRSHVLGLSYFERTSGSNVFVAELQDSIGAIIRPNQVIYSNALAGGCVAHILYRNNLSTFQQDILLPPQELPAPEAYGFNPAETLIQVWSEFISPPPPATIDEPLRRGDNEQTIDTHLNFGEVTFGPGRAFTLGDPDIANLSERAVKQWVILEGRSFLVESVPFRAVAAALGRLGQTGSIPSTNRQSRIASSSRRLLAAPGALAPTSSKPLMLASAATTPGPAYDIDYVSYLSQSNSVFQSDTTYYLSGNVSMVGSNVFEGGTVLKFATNVTIYINPSATTPSLSFLGSDYRPIICTAKDDDSIGETISGSTSTPTNFYAGTALNFSGIPETSITNLRVLYAKQAIGIGGGTINVYDSQFVNCGNSFVLGGATLRVRNTLLANNSTNFLLNGGTTVDCQNASIGGSKYLATAGSVTNNSGVALTNCILANVTNLGAGVFTLTGAYNAFYATTPSTMGLSSISLSDYPFLSLQAGNYYLSDSSACRNAGTTNVDPVLLSSLRRKTSDAPI